MSIESFLNNEWVVLEKAGNLSSYASVLVEQSLDHRVNIIHGDVFPEVRGYVFEWGLIEEYQIDNLFIWHFHFHRLQEEIEKVGMTADDIVMTCLAFFDLDFWPDGQSFWGGEAGIWPQGDSIWQRGGDRPEIQNCLHNVPKYVEFFHGTETNSLSIECIMEDESSARHWIGNVFLQNIVDEMLRHVEESLIRYGKE
jgi:hypothetical protein